MALNSNHHIRCVSTTCAFVVHDRYFADKQRFTPGICPNCGSPVEVVDPFTTRVSRTHHLGINPNEAGSYRRVVPNEAVEA